MVFILVFKRPKPLNEEDIDYNRASFSEEMKETRAYKIKHSKFFKFFRESVAFMVFYVLLAIVSYGDKG